MPGDSTPSLGFLAIVQHELHGLFGGYLLLNSAGRPLEFHCTAPVKPNRAQQILYGPTLEPYLYGEQIGATLINASQQLPLAVLVDQHAALAVRQHIQLPAAMMAHGPSNTATSPNGSELLPGDERGFTAQQEFDELTVGHNHLWVPKRYAADRALLLQRLSSGEEWFDFSEPFDRIRAAIDEAQRATGKAA
jgi:hypothetical protein